MGERGYQLKGPNNKKAWEESDFPIVCETCLGDNPYVRMTKEPHGKACKICERPYTVFRWKAGTKGRIKSTQLCQTCAKLKNACQTCVLDLQYGLPIEVRDKFLDEEDRLQIPGSDANREYMTQVHEKQLAETGNPYTNKPLNQKLLRMARSTPYYKRNMPHKCSFYAKGECNRGAKCPFLHEMPTDRADPLAHQNIRDRFYGQDDPVAAKMMDRQGQMPTLEPPEDDEITSLWLGNMSEDITPEDLRDCFYSFGELRSIRIVPGKDFAFVQFTTRQAAEAAAEQLYKCLVIKGRLLRLNWATRSEESGTAGFHGPEGRRRLEDGRNTNSGEGEKQLEGKGKQDGHKDGDMVSKDKDGAGTEEGNTNNPEQPHVYQPMPLAPVPGLPAGAPVAPALHMPPMPHLQGYQPPPPSVYPQPAGYAPPPGPPHMPSYGPVRGSGPVYGKHGPPPAPPPGPPPGPPPAPYYASMDPHRLGAQPTRPLLPTPPTVAAGAQSKSPADK
ncbi:unnamed protein product [Ascophyllum nodosum]